MTIKPRINPEALKVLKGKGTHLRKNTPLNCTNVCGDGTVKRLLILGDLFPDTAQFEALAAYGYSVTSCGASADAADVIDELVHADAVFFNNFDFNPFLQSLKPGAVVVSAATGFSFIDLKRVRELGVKVIRLLDYSAPAVVDYMVAAAMFALRPLDVAFNQVRAGQWSKDRLFGREIGRLRAGVVGRGRIGGLLMERLVSFGTEVGFSGRTVDDIVDRYPGLLAQNKPVDDIFSDSDMVFVCCDLNDSSRGLVSSKRVGLLPTTSIIISISPNDVIDLDALSTCLDARPDLTAVLDLDPISPTHPLLSKPRAFLSPHIAFATGHTVTRRIDESIQMLVAAEAGKPVPWLL